MKAFFRIFHILGIFCLTFSSSGCDEENDVKTSLKSNGCAHSEQEKNRQNPRFVRLALSCFSVAANFRLFYCMTCADMAWKDRADML